MDNKAFYLAAAKFLYPDALGYNQHKSGCVDVIGSDNIGEQVIDVISQDGLSAKQLNNLIEKIKIDVLCNETTEKWESDLKVSDLKRSCFIQDKSRNRSMTMCAAKYLGVDYDG